MDAEQALADLTEISSQIQAAVVFDEQGKVAAATVDDAAQADELAAAARELLAAADDLKPGESKLTQLEVATGEGSVFVVRDGDGKTCIAATTGSNPTVGLVFYDLKSALRNVTPKPKPARSRKKTSTAAPAAKKKKTTAARKTTPRKRKTDAS